MLMILPLFCSIIIGATALHDNHTPLRFTSITRSHSSGGISPKGTLAIGIVAHMAAFVTRMSIEPNDSTLVSTIRCTLFSSDTSVGTLMAVNPPCSNSSAKPAPASPSSSAITTLAPSCARPLQYSLPIPCPPPVTTAVFPSNRSPDRDIAPLLPRSVNLAGHTAFSPSLLPLLGTISYFASSSLHDNTQASTPPHPATPAGCRK